MKIHHEYLNLIPLVNLQSVLQGFQSARIYHHKYTPPSRDEYKMSQVIYMFFQFFAILVFISI